MGVGSYSDPNTRQERFFWSKETNGTWSTPKNLVPASGIENAPIGTARVSCVSDNLCLAVSIVQISGTNLSQSWTYDGTSWTSGQVIPSPGDATSYDDVTGVKCVTATTCLAVGTYYAASNTTKAWVSTWTPFGGWQSTASVVTPPPDVTSNSSYSGWSVSCSSSTSCFAIGSYLSSNASGNLRPFEVYWDGTSWYSGVVLPVPATTNGDASLRQITCNSHNCLAVGTKNTLSTERTIVDVWAPSTPWTTSVISVPKPYSTWGPDLPRVSCLRGSTCHVLVRVSNDFPKTAKEVVDVTFTNGVQSAAAAFPSPLTNGTSISALGCVATNSCFAVGASYRKAVSQPLVALLGS